MRTIPWQSRKELHLQLAARCGVYHGLPPWFSMHFKWIAPFLAKSANEKKIRSVDERWHLRSANSASITSPSHWPSSGDFWAPGAGMQCLASAGPQLQHERGPAVLSSARKAWMVRSTGAGTRKLFEKIVHQRRDMQRLIPYRTRVTVARPASGHSCRPTFL